MVLDSPFPLLTMAFFFGVVTLFQPLVFCACRPTQRCNLCSIKWLPWLPNCLCEIWYVLPSIRSICSLTVFWTWMDYPASKNGYDWKICCSSPARIPCSNRNSIFYDFPTNSIARTKSLSPTLHVLDRDHMPTAGYAILTTNSTSPTAADGKGFVYWDWDCLANTGYHSHRIDRTYCSSFRNDCNSTRKRNTITVTTTISFTTSYTATIYLSNTMELSFAAWLNGERHLIFFATEHDWARWKLLSILGEIFRGRRSQVARKTIDEILC